MSIAIPPVYPPSYENVTKVLFVIAPSLQQVDATTLEQFYAICYPQVSYNAFGRNTALALANMMAHYITLATDPLYADAGVFSEKELGEAKLKYNNHTATTNTASSGGVYQDFCRTPYGRTYLSLVDRCVTPWMVTNRTPYMGGVTIALPPQPYNSYYNQYNTY